MNVAETPRLRLRWLAADDADFVLRLVNEPAWIRYIGDKGVRTREDAARYIANGPAAMYARTGFGLYAVESKTTGEPLGICGLIKRDTLDDADLGFAFLPQFRRNGYALEAASAVIAYGRNVLGLSRIVAIVTRDNHRSSSLLDKLGFRYERTIAMPPSGERLSLYAAALDSEHPTVIAPAAEA